MTGKGKEMSMMELCKVFQERNKLIFGERAPPPRQQRLANVTDDALLERTKTHQVTRKITRTAPVQQHVTELCSTQCTNHEQMRKRQPHRSLPKLYVARSYDAEQRTEGTASKLQAPTQLRTQKQRRVGTHKVMVRKRNKPSLSPILGVDLRTDGSGETSIRKQRCRRHGMRQLMRAVPEAGHDQVDMRMITENATKNEAVVVQHRKSQAVLKQAELLINKHKTEGHQNIQKHLETTTSDDIQARSSGIVIRKMNEGIQSHCSTFQNGSTQFHKCQTRRNGVFKQADSTQQELMFIRVLRKRF